MKKSMRIALAAAGLTILFGGLVYAVLVAAHLSEPAPASVQGLTPRRLWATTAALLGLAGAVAGGLVASRPTRSSTATARLGTNVALGAGLMAAVNGGLNLAVANGGPGTGNGVVGGATAFVLGLVALALGGRALVRSRSAALDSGRSA